MKGLNAKKIKADKLLPTIEVKKCLERRVPFLCT